MDKNNVIGKKYLVKGGQLSFLMKISYPQN